jgi:hypothetical protein
MVRRAVPCVIYFAFQRFENQIGLFSAIGIVSDKFGVVVYEWGGRGLGIVVYYFLSMCIYQV